MSVLPLSMACSSLTHDPRLECFVYSSQLTYLLIHLCNDSLNECVRNCASSTHLQHFGCALSSFQQIYPCVFSIAWAAFDMPRILHVVDYINECRQGRSECCRCSIVSLFMIW